MNLISPKLATKEICVRMQNYRIKINGFGQTCDMSAARQAHTLRIIHSSAVTGNITTQTLDIC